MKWWQELIVWAPLFFAFVLLMHWIPIGYEVLLLTLVGVTAWLILKRR
jgi:hypothetical protein